MRLFLLALLARAIFFAAGIYHGEQNFSPAINEDSGQYVALAHSLLAGRGFVREVAPPFSPEYWRTPGYPIFLAIFFAVYDKLWFAVLFQIVISSLSVVLLFRLGKSFLPGRWAVLPAVLMAIEPATLYWSVELVTETLFTFILLAGINFLLKRQGGILTLKAAFLLGAILGLLSYVRPSGTILFPLIVALLIYYARNNWKRSLLPIAIFFLVVWTVLLPWKIRNKIVFDFFEFSSIGNVIGFGKTLSWYTYTERGLTFAQAYPDIYALNEGNTFIYGHALKKAAIASFISDPLPYAKMAAGSMIPFFFGDGWNTAMQFLSGKVEPAQTKWLGSVRELLLHPLKYGTAGAFFWIGKSTWFIIIFLAAIGYILEILKKGSDKKIQLTFLALIILFFAITSGVTSYSRFRQPVNPYIFIFFALGLERCWTYLSLYRKKA